MRHKLITSLLDIIEASLDPFEPVSFSEALRGVTATNLSNILLQILDAFHFIISKVVPAKIHTSIILRLVIRRQLVLLLWDEKVGSKRRNIVRILAVVAIVILVVNIWLVDRLRELLLILFVCPLCPGVVIFTSFYEQCLSFVYELYHFVYIFYYNKLLHF